VERSRESTAEAAAAAPVAATASIGIGAPAGLLLRLQRGAGNAAVSRWLLRQDAAARLHEEPVTTDPMEFISSSTQTEFAEGWFTDRVVQLMHQRHIGFVEAARAIARGNLTGHGEHATRSGDLRAVDPLADPPLRRALALSVAHYHGPHHDPNLPEVASQLGTHGTATQALRQDYGGANTRIVRDPTAAQIGAAIQQEITTLGRAAAHDGRQAELTIVFGGHGDHTGMEGSDGTMFTLAALSALNQAAMAVGVHLIVISDECMQGAGALLAEELASPTMRQRVDAAPVPPERAAAMRETLGHAEQLIEFAQSLNPVLDDLGVIAEGDTAGQTPTQAVADLRLHLLMLDSYDHFVARGFVAASPELNLRIQAVWGRLRTIHPSNHAQVVALVRDLRFISDHLTEEVAQLQELVQTELDLSGM
jgi:hypothetical protein